MLRSEKYMYNVEINGEETRKEYDFLGDYDGAVYADSFRKTVWKEKFWIVIFDQLFTADCGLCDSDNVCGTCAGWIFVDDCGGCRFSFVCSVGAVFFEKQYISK